MSYPYLYIISMSNDGSPGAGISYDLHVYDATNKAAPEHVGFAARTQTAAFNWERGNVVFNKNFVYSPEPATGKLAIFNVADKSNPTVATIVPVGNTPVSVAIYGNHAYVANLGSQSISVVDITDPGNASVVGTFATGAPSPATLAIYKNQLVVGLRGTHEIEVYDLNNPALPVSLARFASSTTHLNGPTEILVKDDMIIVGHGDCAWNWGDAVTDRCGVSLINISNATAPKIISELPGGLSWRIALSGNYIFGVSYYSSQSTKVYDISDPAHAVQINWNVANASGISFSTDANTSVDGRSNQVDFRQGDVLIDQGYAFVITGSEMNYSSIQVIDFTKLLGK